MKTEAHEDVAEAVRYSIFSKRSVMLQTDETIADLDERRNATLEHLEDFGLEDWTVGNSGAVDAWGTTAMGREWRVHIVDLLERDLASYDL